MSAPASLAARYVADGFYSPVDVLSREEATAAYSQYQQYVERYGVGGSLQGDTRYRRSEDVCAVPNRLGRTASISPDCFSGSVFIWLPAGRLGWCGTPPWWPP